MPANIPILEITDESGASRRVEVTASRMIVGRISDSDLALPAEGVSRRHAELLRDPTGRWWIRDLASRNGTHVNGRRVQESIVTPGDQMAIGPYTLRFVAPLSKSPMLTTIAGQLSVTHDEPAGAGLKLLEDIPAPQVQATHLSRLVQFGRLLSEVDDPQSRLRMLCELLTSGGFPGKCAVAVRIDAGEDLVKPQPLLSPVYNSTTGNSREVPYLSGRLLSAVRQRRAPVLASNVAGRAASIEMSLAPTVQAQAAIACPIGNSDCTIDVVYTVLATVAATGEWLAVAGLAVEQYRQSESLWAQRKMAQEHALLQQELDQAKKVQQSLVPRDVKIPSLDWAVQFHPCRWVGGDYIDLIPAPSGKVVLVVADVCGHGMQAALLASSLHSVLHTLIPTETPIEGIMTHLNDYLCRTLSNGMFVTAACVELDAQNGNTRAISAGHPLPILISGQGSWQHLKCAEFLPLGVESGQKMTAERDALAPSSVLALYTDGLFEVQLETTMLGVKGLGQQLAAKYQPSVTPSKTIAESLMQYVHKLQGGTLASDDQSLLVVQRR